MAALETLTTVALNGCTEASIAEVLDRRIFKSEQTVRNCFTQLSRLGLLINKNGKKIVDPSIKIGISDTVLLDLKILYNNESKETKKFLSTDSTTT